MIHECPKAQPIRATRCNLAHEFRIAQLVHIDPAIAADIHHVMMMAYTVEAKLLGVTDFPPLWRTADDIGLADSSFLGSFQNNLLLGVLEYETSFANSIAVAAVVVLPRFFRLGIASAMIKHIIRRHDGTRIEVCTAAANRPALSLYRQHNFAVAETWLNGDDIPMVRLLREPQAGDTTPYKG